MSSKQSSNESSNRSILDAYRTLGRFVSGSMNLSSTLPLSIAVPTNNSYKIYSEDLAIKVVSPPLHSKVRDVICENEYSYVRTQNEILKIKYHHIVREWTIPQLTKSEQPSSKLFKFANLIVLGEGNKVFIVDEEHPDEEAYEEFEVGFEMTSTIHPVTYVNKLVVYNQNKFALVNPISKKILYSYPKLLEHLTSQQSKTIKTVQSSKLVDIVAISLSDGSILILNLKKDEIVFKLKLKQCATAITFSDQHALMATADAMGNVVLWDLEKKKILYKFQEFVEGEIDSINFIPGKPLLTVGSSGQNCLKQLRVNLEDNRILTLFRERVGITSPIEKIQLLNNTQIMLSSRNESMFSSLYSHSNNYKLNRVLDSSSPYHLISRHFSIQIFKNQTMQKSHNIHESAYIGRISLSQKYFVVATRSRLIKLGASGVEVKVSGIVDIALFQEHYVFVFTQSTALVLDFVTFTIVKDLGVGKCSTPRMNQFGNLLAFYMENTQRIVVLDMEKLQIAREFESEQSPKCMCFSSENRYLISSHPSNCTLRVWSIVHNNLFKSFRLEKPIIDMDFSEDNQYFLSVFQGDREVCIWNNYIGRLSSNRSEQFLRFLVTVNYHTCDIRETLSRAQQGMRLESKIEEEEEKDGLDSTLDKIKDATDPIPNYSFQSSQQRLLPLIYYDEIRQRNTVQSETVSLPFFLDFENLDEQKKKMQDEAKEDLLKQRREKQDSIDKHLKVDGQSHSIQLNENSSVTEFCSCVQMLQTLSIAEIDYQLRTFLLNPMNKRFLLKMFLELMQDPGKSSCKASEELKNILLHRSLDLMGTEVFDEEIKEIVVEILAKLGNSLKKQKEKVDRCIGIVQKIM